LASNEHCSISIESIFVVSTNHQRRNYPKEYPEWLLVLVLLYRVTIFLKSKMKMRSGHEMFSMKVELSKRNTMFRNKIMIRKVILMILVKKAL
jgi:hypothetical protein